MHDNLEYIIKDDLFNYYIKLLIGNCNSYENYINYCHNLMKIEYKFSKNFIKLNENLKKKELINFINIIIDYEKKYLWDTLSIKYNDYNSNINLLLNNGYTDSNYKNLNKLYKWFNKIYMIKPWYFSLSNSFTLVSINNKYFTKKIPIGGLELISICPDITNEANSSVTYAIYLLNSYRILKNYDFEEVKYWHVWSSTKKKVIF